MALNDSLSDMLARIKNAHQANKVSTLCLKSKLNMNVLSVLKDEGYIRDFKNIEERKGVNSIKIELKYYNGSPVIKKIKRISKHINLICYYYRVLFPQRKINPSKNNRNIHYACGSNIS